MDDNPRLPGLQALAAPDVSAKEDSAQQKAEYRERLREHLKDPAFRAIEGFPIGDDEAILALSDPPYYTACPNPFLPEIIERWQAERAETRARLGLPDDSHDNGRASQDGPHPPPLSQRGEGSERSPLSPLGEGRGVREAASYHREPFAADVSEGKNDPIYNAHSYHTKVPHKAIMRYILHYTDPGDIVFDGFCGTGMTGVAAQLCGDRKAVEGLGYRVDAEGIVPTGTSPFRGIVYDAGKPISRLGPRKAALVDLSPAATFIAYNYNTPVDADAFEREARRILREVEEECGWMYETWHPNCDDPNRVKARINYTVWSEVFLCPQCSGEITFLDEALDPQTMRVREAFPCPHCGALLGKRILEKSRVRVFDSVLDQTRETLARRPALIEYAVGDKKHTKQPDPLDLGTVRDSEILPPMDGLPSNAFPIAKMYHGSRLAPKGITHIHHLFMPRASRVLSSLWAKAMRADDPRVRAFLLFAFEQAIWGMSLLNRYGPTHYSQTNRYLSGVYYISSLISEVSPWYILDGKVDRLTRAFGGLPLRPAAAVIGAQSSTVGALPEASLDYIFVDPPFGENIYYADLNYLVESWHGVTTNSGPEAIVDQAKQKGMREYQDLMRGSFRTFFTALKPGRWITVEFHNSHNAVWSAIQEALMSVGFVVADVRTLDKQQSSYRQVTAASAAKQDLVISAYKPRTSFERRFQAEAGTPEGAWDFVRQHLGQLPVVVEKKGALETTAERQGFLLFDRMVAFHIQRGATVPLSAAEFYAGLKERFVEREGMYFLPEQAPEYDRARLLASGVEQLALFVKDEKSTIQWLRQQLDPATGGRPQTYQDLQPQFLRQLHQAQHEALPELSEMLAQSFLQDADERWYTPDPNRASDLEQVRERALLREFAAYMEGRGRLKQFRTEAVRAGFADAWRRRDYASILKVAERLPESVLQEDQDLLMYYDNASLRA